MGWEARGGGRLYYVRYRKVAGRVTRQYIGTGPVAEVAFAADVLRRADRRAAAEACRAERDRWLAALAPLLELSRAVDVVVRATLLAGGFHRHARTWRKKRNVNSDDNAPEARRDP
jgi:hypothetical protein